MISIDRRIVWKLASAIVRRIRHGDTKIDISMFELQFRIVRRKGIRYMYGGIKSMDVNFCIDDWSNDKQMMQDQRDLYDYLKFVYTDYLNEALKLGHVYMCNPEMN